MHRQAHPHRPCWGYRAMMGKLERAEIKAMRSPMCRVALEAFGNAIVGQFVDTDKQRLLSLGYFEEASPIWSQWAWVQDNIIC